MNPEKKIKELELENQKLKSMLRKQDGTPLNTHVFDGHFLSIQNIPDAVIITQMGSGMILEVNRHFCQMLDYQEHEVLGKTVEEIKLWQFPGRRVELLEMLSGRQKVSNFSCQFLTSSSEPRYVLISAHRFEKDGEDYLFSLIRDISQWRELKEVVEKTEKKYHQLYDNVPFGLYKSTPEGEITEANEALVRLLEYPELEELRKINVKDLYVNKKDYDNKNFHPSEDGTYVNEILLRTYNGKEIWVLDVMRANFNEKNEVTSYEGSIRDISARVNTRKELEGEREKFKILSEYLKSAVFTFDEKGCFNYVNKAMENITGYSNKELIGMKFWEIVHPEHRDMVLKRGMGRVRGKKITHSYEFKINTKNHETKWVEISNARIKINNENLVLGSAIDITQRKAALDKLIESEQRLYQITENLNDVIWIRDYKTDAVIFASSAFTKVWERDITELEDAMEFWRNSIHEDDLDRVMKVTNEGKKTGNYEVEYRIRLDGGKLKWIQQKAEVINDEMGFPNRITGVSRDITDQKYNHLLQSTVYNITSGVISKTDLNEVFLTIKEELGNIVDTTNIFIILYNKENDTLSLPFFVDEKDQFDELPAGKTLSSYVIRKGKPCLFREKEMNELELKGEIELVGSTSKVWMGAPLISDGNVIGLIGLQNYQSENALNERDLEMLEFISNQLAILLERSKIENNLRESEEKFRHLAENIPGIVYLCRNDEAYTMMYLNDMIEAYTGHNKSSFLSGEMAYADFIHPDDAAYVRKKIVDSLAESSAFSIEYRLKHARGFYRWVKEVGVGVWHDKKLQHLEGFVIDVNDQKEAEMKLRNELFINQALASVSSELLSAKMSFEKISTLVLNHARTLTGSKHGLLGSYDALNTFNIHSCTFFGQGVRSYAIEEKKINGNEVWLNDILEKGIFFANDQDMASRVNGEPFKTISISRIMSLPAFIHGKVNGHILLINPDRDFLEDDMENIKSLMDLFALAINRNQIENEILLAKEKAEESDRLKTAFLANMSHEIRTPLNGVLGFAELLGYAQNEKDRKDYIKVINESGFQLLHIINDIIDLSKIEAGELEIRYDRVNLNELFSTLFSIYHRKIEKIEKDVTLHIDAPESHLIINSDPKRLQQVLSNLMDNAVKFTKNGKITFGYKKLNSERLQFFVKDTGVGIDKNKQDYIFERFRQLDDSFTREFGGTGLGLAICKNILSLMEGRIWVESEKNKGSAFYFELPYICAEETEDQKTMDPGRKIDRSWEGKSILVVEDDDANFLFLKTVLEQTRIQVKWARNGREAVDVFNQHPDIDLILMDLQLPVLSGLDATRQIKEHSPHVPIIAQTAFAMPDDEEKCLKAGCDGYIAKPIKMEHLFEELSKHI